jgi:hypothetical protein
MLHGPNSRSARTEFDDLTNNLHWIGPDIDPEIYPGIQQTGDSKRQIIVDKKRSRVDEIPDDSTYDECSEGNDKSCYLPPKSRLRCKPWYQ